MSETIVEKRFKVEEAYNVFTEDLRVPPSMAEGLVHRDYWTLIDRMRKVAADELEPPEFVNDDALDEFYTRCGDIAYGYVYEVDAYAGRLCIDLDDGGNVEFWLDEVFSPGLLKNPADMDEWAPWCRQDLKAVACILEEHIRPKVDWVEFDMVDNESESEIILRYCRRDKNK